MKAEPIVHGSFTIERTYTASIARVFAAWSDLELKARWFIGPPEKWRPLKRALDFRVGGTEVLHGELNGGPETLFVARYHAIVPEQRLVYAYDMSVGSVHLSVSLATVELAPTQAGGTRMTFTEQTAFLDGKDGTKSRDIGTAAHFDRLALTLDDPSEVVSARVFDAPRDVVFRAFSDPKQLATWWGPKGFTNSFSEFDLRTGGAWRFTMRGPDGAEYPNAKQFLDVVAPERLVLQHLQETHRFTMTMTFVDLGPQTWLTWRMRFDSIAELEPIRAIIIDANEQNLDRLAAHLQSVT